MKICSKCKKSKPLTEFYKGKAYRGGYKSYCKICQRDFPTQTPKKTLERAIRIRQRNQKYIWDFYSKHTCVDCGESDPVVLELDHVRGEKIANVSQLVHGTHALRVIDEEIAKCEVVCANCHRKRTARTQGWYQGLIGEDN